MRALAPILLALTLVACRDEAKPAAPAASPTPAPTATPVGTPFPVVSLDGGASYQVVRPGAGTPLAADAEPLLRLEVTRGDGSREYEGKLSFRRGTGQGFPVLDRGLDGMLPGEIRRVLVPGKLVPTPAGDGAASPAPDAVYIVELLSVNPPPTPNP